MNSRFIMKGRLAALAGLLCLLVLAPALPAAALDTAASVTLTLYHTNDVHGRFDESFSGTYDSPIGIDGIAAVKANTEHALLLDGGDALHGTPAVVLTGGMAAVRLMNAAGYDFMAIGNHDFNYGRQGLDTLRGAARFPIAAANIRRDGEAVYDETRIVELGGVKVGLFGLSTESTPSTTMPVHVEGLVFENAVETARKKTAKLKAAGAQVIVAVGHMGETSATGASTSEQIVGQVEGIDVFIDGHSHSVYPRGKLAGNTLIVSAGQYEQHLGRVEITVNDGRIVSKKAELLTAEDVAAIPLSGQAAAKKQELQDLIADIQAGLSPRLQETVASSVVSLSAARAPGVRTEQTDIGWLVAESYRWTMQADIGIANGGDIRADITPGELRYQNVISILPFFNALQVKTVTPALLKQVLENGVSQIVLTGDGKIDHEKSANGRFPQIAGFSFTYDPTGSPGDRIIDITLDDGTKLELSDTSTKLRLAASEYILSGGDDYAMLADVPVDREYGLTAEQALIAYLKEHTVTEAWLRAYNADRIRLKTENKEIKSETQTENPKTQTENPKTGGSDGLRLVCLLPVAVVLVSVRLKKGGIGNGADV